MTNDELATLGLQARRWVLRVVGAGYILHALILPGPTCTAHEVPGFVLAGVAMLAMSKW